MSNSVIEATPENSNKFYDWTAFQEPKWTATIQQLMEEYRQNLFNEPPHYIDQSKQYLDYLQNTLLPRFGGGFMTAVCKAAVAYEEQKDKETLKIAINDMYFGAAIHLVAITLSRHGGLVNLLALKEPLKAYIKSFISAEDVLHEEDFEKMLEVAFQYVNAGLINGQGGLTILEKAG